MKFKKTIAPVLSMVLAFSMTVPAFAADPTPKSGSATGTGKVEYVYNENVFSVVLPTVPTNTLNFTLDPQGVLAETNAEKYTDAKTLYFANVGEDGSVTYSDTSDAMEIKNKSTFAVDVSVDAVVSTLEVTDPAAKSATLATASTFTADDATKHIFLALVDEETSPTSSPVDGTTKKATLTRDALGKVNTITGSGDDPDIKPYKITALGEGAYKYEWNSAFDKAGGTIPSYKFKLTGASNPAADWSGLDKLAPTVTLTWSVLPDDALSYDDSKYVEMEPVTEPTEPAIANVTLTAGSAATTTITWADAASISTLTVSPVGGQANINMTPDTWSVEGDTLTLGVAHVNWLAGSATGASYTATFDTGDSVTFTGTVQK